MAGPTLTERVEELRRDLAAIKLSIVREDTTNQLFREASPAKGSEHRALLDKYQEKVSDLEKSLSDTQKQIATLEVQIKSLEKSNDRTWQVAPMVSSAVAVLISLLVAFVKK